MNTWEVFVNNLNELPEGQDLTLSIRTLNPGIHKYAYARVRCRVSPAPERYPDALQIRFGRGQLHPQRYSVEVLEEVPIVPQQYHWNEADIEFVGRSM